MECYDGTWPQALLQGVSNFPRKNSQYSMECFTVDGKKFFWHRQQYLAPWFVPLASDRSRSNSALERRQGFPLLFRAVLFFCSGLNELWLRLRLHLSSGDLTGAVPAASLCCVGFRLGFQSLSAPPHLARQEKSAESSSPRCARQEYALALTSRQRVVWQARQCNDASER